MPISTVPVVRPSQHISEAISDAKKDVLQLEREMAHLKAVSELKDRVDGASGFFYDLFDRTNKGSIAQLDTWEKEVDVLTAGTTSIVVADNEELKLQPGMEITVQSNSDPDVLERVIVTSIVPEADGVTYTLNLKDPLAHDYPEGALLYRSKGNVVEGKFIFAAKRGEFGAKTYTPDILPTGSDVSAAFSPDGVYLAVAHYNSPCLTIYKRTGDTFTKLPDPSVLPTGQGNGVAFSPDGNYLAVAHYNPPYLTIYKRTGDTFTKLPNPSPLPTGNGNGTAFSPDGVYLAVARYNSPFITIYKRELDSFIKLPDPPILPTGTGRGVAFSPRGDFLAIAHSSSPYITIYGTGSTLTPMKQIDIRYNIVTSEPFASLAAWVERERETSYTLECAVSMHSGEENYQTLEAKTALIDATYEEYQYTITGNPQTRATLRLTAIKDDFDVIARIRKITGVVGN